MTPSSKQIWYGIGAIAVLLLSGIAYAIYSFAPRGPALSTVKTTETSTGTEMKVEVIYGSTDVYGIEVHYPQFDIASVDAKIQAVVDKVVAEFKTYPQNPHDSSVPVNELTGSFDSVYIGADIVSAALSISEYTGGVHPNTVTIGVNVDRATGRELSLDDVLAMIGKTLSQVAAGSLAQLNAKFEGHVPFPEGAEAKAENYSTFLVGKNAVKFIFNDYQVASHADGPQETSFPRKY